MCQVNKMVSETMQCKCKQLCCKMQNNSLRCAIDILKCYQDDTKTIKKTLKSIANLLEVYSCLPSTCLVSRVKWVDQKIDSGSGPLYSYERIMVDMLIEELETFLSNN